MPDLERDRSLVRVNDDGELIGGLFCVYCGEINEPGVDCCESCGQYIADQGPDLSARLRRIRRYASSVHDRVDDVPQMDLIGSKRIGKALTLFEDQVSSHREFWKEVRRLTVGFFVGFSLGLLLVLLLTR